MIVKRTLFASHPDSLGALKILAKIGGISDLTITPLTDNSEFQVRLEVEASSPFDASTKTTTVDGYVSCVEYLSKVAPEIGLWADGVDTWVKSACSYLAEIAYVLDEEKGMYFDNELNSIHFF